MPTSTSLLQLIRIKQIPEPKKLICQLSKSTQSSHTLLSSIISLQDLAIPLSLQPSGIPKYKVGCCTLFDIIWPQKTKEASSCHGAIEFLYEGSFTPILIKTPNHILAATFFIVDSVNSVVCFVTQKNTNTNSNDLRKKQG